MATWTPLTTTYAAGNVINVATWNALTGFSGNLQYLYDQLIPEMYINGYISTSFIFTTNNLVYGINPDVYNDIRPSNVDLQINNSSFTGIITARKEGLYLFSASTVNTGSWNTPNISLYKNNTEISESLHNFIPRYASANEAKTPTIINHFSIDRASQNDEYFAIASKTTGGNMNIQFSPGNLAIPENYFVKSPYITNVFLNTPGVNALAPTPIFLLDPSINLSLAERMDPLNTAGSSDKWVSAILPSTSTTMYAFPDTINTYASNPLYWRKLTNYNNNKMYVFPNTSSSYPTSYATWRWWPQSSTASNFNYGFMMVVIKSFDELASGSTNYEQNIISLHTIDRVNEIIGTPISVTAYRNNANTLISIYLRVANKQLLIDEISPSAVGNGYILSLECGEVNANRFVYSKIRCNAGKSGTREIIITDTSSSYNMSNIKVMTLGGVEFFTISNTQANSKSTLSYYYVGNWRLADITLNPLRTTGAGNIAVGDGIDYTAQKPMLWDTMASEFNVNQRSGSSSTSSNASNIIEFDNYVFSANGRFI